MEQDLDSTAKAILVEQKIDKMLDIVANAKTIRKAFNEEQQDILSVTHEVPGLDAMSVSLGLAKVSDEFFNEFETTLYEISEMAKGHVDTVSIQHTALVESFIVFISELKPRSLRHLENFLDATTSGEWVDGLMLGHGKDSEFRCIDRCSDVARSEFGINK